MCVPTHHPKLTVHWEIFVLGDLQSKFYALLDFTVKILHQFLFVAQAASVKMDQPVSQTAPLACTAPPQV